MLLSPKMMIKKTKMEHLYLKNFGPIKEMDIDLKPLMVFIGESAVVRAQFLSFYRYFGGCINRIIYELIL